MLKAGKPFPDEENNRDGFLSANNGQGAAFLGGPCLFPTKLETWTARLVACLIIQAGNRHARRIGTHHATKQLWPIPAD
jgi:hypothetical protein